MAISIDVGPAALELGAEGDLGKYLSPGISSLFRMGEALRAVTADPRATLADVPEGAFHFGISHEARWDLGTAANLTLTVVPGFSASVAFMRSEPVVSWLDGDDRTLAVAAPPHHVYVSIAFEVNLEVGGGLQYSSGSFGVKANLSHDDRFRIANHRLFAARTPVLDAVREAFQEFHLPFHTSGVAALREQDLLEYEFLGNLSAGFGVSYGLGKVQLAGRSAGEVARSLNNSLARLALTADPAVFAGARFGVNWTHEDAFRFVFAREPGGNAATLTILRKDKQALSTKATAGITLDPGIAYNRPVDAPTVVDSAVDHLFGAAQPTAASALKRKLREAGLSAVDQFGTKMVERVNAMLAPGDGAVQLQFLHERASARTALFRLRFNLASPAGLETGVRLALEGRIAEAVAHPSVTVDPGSLVEREFTRRATLGFQFFDLWKWSDAVEYIEKIGVVYAGGGMLRLVALEGVKHTSGIVGHQSDCDVHFAVEAGQAAGSSQVSDLDVRLHFILRDGSRARARETIRILQSLGLPEAAEIEAAFARERAAVRTTCVFDKEEFARFRADPYPGGRPAPLPHPLDEANYAAFAAAVRAVEGSFLGFPSYADWAEFNRVAYGGENSSGPPRRRAPGNLNAWPQAFARTPDSQRGIVRYHSESARQFMNLCESLGQLGGSIDAATTEESFGQLLSALNGIIDHDVPPAFLKATLLALINVARLAVRAQTVQDGNTLAVTLSGQSHGRSAPGAAAGA